MAAASPSCYGRCVSAAASVPVLPRLGLERIPRNVHITTSEQPPWLNDADVAQHDGDDPWDPNPAHGIPLPFLFPLDLWNVRTLLHQPDRLRWSPAALQAMAALAVREYADLRLPNVETVTQPFTDSADNWKAAVVHIQRRPNLRFIVSIIFLGGRFGHYHVYVWDLERRTVLDLDGFRPSTAAPTAFTTQMVCLLQALDIDPRGWTAQTQCYIPQVGTYMCGPIAYMAFVWILTGRHLLRELAGPAPFFLDPRQVVMDHYRALLDFASLAEIQRNPHAHQAFQNAYFPLPLPQGTVLRPPLFEWTAAIV
jgi:hypothetical protein